MCALCDHGFCPRHDTARERISLDPCYADWREQELEAQNTEASTVYFESPYKDAR